jgi:hypothetical protein
MYSIPVVLLLYLPGPTAEAIAPWRQDTPRDSRERSGLNKTIAVRSDFGRNFCLAKSTWILKYPPMFDPFFRFSWVLISILDG